MLIRVLRPFGPYAKGDEVPNVPVSFARHLFCTGHAEPIHQEPAPERVERAVGKSPETATRDRVNPRGI